MKRVLIGLMGAAALSMFAAPAAAQDPKVERGIKVYAEQKCMMCHSIAGKGNAKGALEGVGTKLTAEEIRQWIVDPAAMTAKHKTERRFRLCTERKELKRSSPMASTLLTGSPVASTRSAMERLMPSASCPRL